MYNRYIYTPVGDSLVVSIPASYMLGRRRNLICKVVGLRPGWVILKTILKDLMVQTASIVGTYALGYCRSLTVQPSCLKGQVVFGTDYGDIHY